MKARPSLSHRVFRTVFLVALAIVAVFTLSGTAYLQASLAESTRSELRDEAHVVATALDGAHDGVGLLREMELEGTRITLLAADGSVLYDSEEDPAAMPNHAGRPEVRAAMNSGSGSSERASATMGETMVYEAFRLEDGDVVRLAKRREGYLAIVGRLAVPMMGLAALVALVAWYAARRESRAIIDPLLQVDLDEPVRNLDGAYAEMAPMLERLEKQRRELKRQMRVLADNDRMRREFTANITHELKTPLTAISGYSELMASGLVASEEDARDFARRIHDEAGRLTGLVNDILTLSNLDEAEHHAGSEALGAMGPLEPVDLFQLLDSISKRLEDAAARAGVSISLECEPVVVTGVARLLDELACNLASNAIRYNREGGSVVLSCGARADGSAFLAVEDSGIGIAETERDKVFERFYRVDKSRSKARGGTGLGLAIVKHAALLHGARIDLQSELGEGTRIEVVFPLVRTGAE